MAKAYNVGDRLYLPVWVTNKESNLVMYKDNNELVTDAKFSYVYSRGETRSGEVRYGEPGLLLTTEEVAEEYKDKATVRIQLLEKENEMHRKTICNRDKEIEGLEAKRDDLEAKLTLANEIISDKDKDIHDLSEVCDDWKGATEELKSRNAELEALLKEVVATRDEAIRQNDELITENSKLKDGADKLKDTLVDRTKDVQHLTEENDKLKTDLDQRNKDFDAMKKDRDNLLADNKRTTAYYMEANRTASEAAEANDDLKAKIADLRNRVGEQLAQIQDLNAEVHFHKEFGEGLDKQQKELQARYDELDSVNKEQAEKIRKLDAERDTWERNAKAWKMTADGMSKRAEELQAENEKLNNRNKYLESEKNRKPIVHVLTNDGHVYAFTSSGKVSVKYHTELNILMIEDGEKTIAGFSRGDKPGNLSAWWMG